VLTGRPYITPLIRKDLGQLPGWPPGAGDASGELTVRQREVVQLVAEGHPVKEIAAILGGSIKYDCVRCRSEPRPTASRGAAGQR